MANARYYSSIAQQTTLTSGVTNSGTSLQVASTAGFPGSVPYILALDYNTATEELVLVTGTAGLTLTVTRSYDGTAGSAHNPGAVVRHVSSAIDFTDSRTHEASTSGVHGVSGNVVGTTDTQTLSNKTLSHVTGSIDNAKLYNKGATGVTQIIGDSLNTGVNRLEILDDESALNVMTLFQSNGALKTINKPSDVDGTYRLRATANDGTTDRFAVLAGGTVGISPNGSTTFAAVDVTAPASTGAKKIFRVAATGGANERTTLWDDGRLVMTGLVNANITLKVNSAPAPAADVFNVSDNAGTTTLFAVQSTGKTVANKSALIVQPGITSGTVLQVGGSNVGYTGNLQAWVNPANAIVGNVTEAGNATFNQIAATTTTWTSFTPTITGGGTATFTTNSAYYYKLGKVVFFVWMAVTNAAGSGGSNIQFTTPSSMDGTIDQNMTATFQSSSTRIGNAVKFTGGSSATMDRIRIQDGGAANTTANLIGSMLTTGSIIDVQGWYREA